MKVKKDFEMPKRLNRMADFHLLGVMTEEVLEWEKGSFTKAYNANIALAQGDVIDNSPIATALIALKDSKFLPFKGTYGELIGVLKLQGGMNDMTPRKLTNELQRLKFSLRKLHGIKIRKMGRVGKGKLLLVEFVGG